MATGQVVSQLDERSDHVPLIISEKLAAPADADSVVPFTVVLKWAAGSRAPCTYSKPLAGLGGQRLELVIRAATVRERRLGLGEGKHLPVTAVDGARFGQVPPKTSRRLQTQVVNDKGRCRS